ncbi:MAG: hypothetical protein FJ087_01165 [Deltaproteobacteria bacterium]|nr:hypothetical protein [Deltaproteobacteria bacterium]
MTLDDVRALLRCEVLAGGDHLGREPTGCFAADMMSDVLHASSHGMLLLTGLTGVQSVHTADVADLAGIVFVLGKRPAPDVLAVADQRGIPVLSTAMSMYAACAALHDGGMA